MFPKNHFLTSAFVVGLFAIWQGTETTELLKWMLIAGVISIAIDFDHLIYPLFRKEKRYLFWNTIRNPMGTLKDLHAFVDKLIFPGLSILHITSHTIFAVIIVAISGSIMQPFLFPITISLSVHIFTDIVDTILHHERW